MNKVESDLRQLLIEKQKEINRLKAKKSGRPKGEPTKVIRVPVRLIPAIEKLIHG